MSGIQVVNATQAGSYPSFNSLPVGTVAFVNRTSGITELPSSDFVGTVMTFARNATTVAGIVQIAVQTAGVSGSQNIGKVYVRSCTSGTWRDWICQANENDVAGLTAAISDAATQSFRTGTIYTTREGFLADVPSGLLGDLPVNRIFCIGAYAVNAEDEPVENFMGTVVTFSYQSVLKPGDFQLAVSRYGVQYVRYYAYHEDGDAWDGWHTLVDTDSIAGLTVTPYPTMITTDARLSALTEGTMSADDFPPNKIICVGALGLNGLNLASVGGNTMGVYLTLSYNGNGNDGYAQVFFNKRGMANRWKVAGAWTDWAVSAKDPEVYYVGPSRSYTSLVSLLIDLRGNTDDKVIYIDEGTYDLFAEYAAEVGAGRLTVPADDITSADYFYPYNAFVPTNTKIVGLGDVTLTFTPTVAQLESLSQDADKTGYGASRTWSPLNVYGAVEMENLTVVGKNCRYCLHNDDHNSYPETKQVYRNCTFRYQLSDTNTGGNLLGFNNTIGFGINSGSVHIFEDCELIFEGAGNHPAYYGHNGSAGKSGTLLLKNCVIRSTDFTDNRVIRLQTLSHGSAGRVEARFENCYINGGMNLSMYYADSVQAFDVTFINSNKVPVTRTIASGGTVSDPYTVRWFNPLGTPTAEEPLFETDNINSQT